MNVIIMEIEVHVMMHEITYKERKKEKINKTVVHYECDKIEERIILL